MDITAISKFKPKTSVRLKAKNEANNANPDNPFKKHALGMPQNNNSNAQNFTGALDAATAVLKTFNDVPMVGVAFTDTVSTNIPRSLVDFKATGPAGGFETLRREFSGLAVNCLLPSFFVLGAAKLINGHYMKDFKGVDASGSWANSESINTLSKTFKNAAKTADGTVENETHLYVKNLLNNLEGLNGKKWVSYQEALNNENGKKAVDLLTGAILDPKMGRSKTKKAIKSAFKLIAGDTEAVQTLRLKGARKNLGTNLSDLLRDGVDLGRKFTSAPVRKNIDGFSAALKKMVNTKSIMGLSVILPLAMSMQYINRAITRHKYKKTGAPIYKDFEKETRVLTPDEQKRLNRNKPICALLMGGLALLSMMKKPSLEMFQFKGMFPTVDQCRWIATGTFASRMFASEDPNELRESTVRDIASFSGLYFLGDYASKATATAIEKATKGDVKLLNHIKETPKDASIFKKFGNWVKNVNVKSFDEVSNSVKNTRYRGLCELASLGFSILTLGVLLPIYNKKVTAKKDAERKAKIAEEQNKIQQMAQQNSIKPMTPSNMLIHPMKDTNLNKNENVSILNGTKVKDLEVTSFNVEKDKIPGSYNFEMKGKFKDWADYTTNSAFQKVATECFK